jgi:hypothetical protein
MNDSMTHKRKTESLRYSAVKAAVGSSTFAAMRNITAALYDSTSARRIRHASIQLQATEAACIEQ